MGITLYSKVFKVVVTGLGKIVGSGMRHMYKKDQAATLQDIKDELTDLSTSLNNLANELNDILRTMNFELNAQIKNAGLDDATNVIEKNYEHYNKLINEYDGNDVSTDLRTLANNILSGSQTNLDFYASRIYNSVIGDTADSTSILSAWTDFAISEMDPKKGIDLNDAYYSLEDYFINLINYQLYAGALVVEAKNEQAVATDKDKVVDTVFGTVDEYISQFQENLSKEVDWFLYCVERLVAASLTNPMDAATYYNGNEDGTIPIVPPDAASIFSRADFIAAQLTLAHPFGMIVRVLGEPATLDILGTSFKSGPTPSQVNYTLPMVSNEVSSKNSFKFDTYDPEADSISLNPFTYTQWMNGWVARENGIQNQYPDNQVMYYLESKKVGILKYHMDNPVVNQPYTFQIPYDASAQGTAQLLDDDMKPTQDTTKGVVYGSCLLTSFHNQLDQYGNPSNKQQTDDKQGSVTGNCKVLQPFGAQVNANGTGKNDMLSSTCSITLTSQFMRDYIYYGNLPKCKLYASFEWSSDDRGKMCPKCTAHAYYADGSTDEFKFTKSDSDTHIRSVEIDHSPKKGETTQVRTKVVLDVSEYQDTQTKYLNFTGNGRLKRLYLLPH